ncbi:MAG TPA: hypothetical protein VMV69_22350 [Pirellulales bacterium]|nr:hypothetical protein [Pirellulales bacterium]
MAYTTAMFTASRDAPLAELSTRGEVLAELEELRALVLEVCPDCLYQRRPDGAGIFVPPQRQHETRDKNLLTVWAGAGARMRIMPDKEEKYDRSKLATYRERLARLYSELVDGND